MSTKNAALRDLLANRFGDSLDGGKIEILHSDGTTILATFTLQTPAFSDASAGGGQVSVAGVPLSATAAATGTATTAKLSSSGATPTYVLSGITITATGGGGEIEVDNTSINSGQVVKLTSYSWTEAAGAS